MYHPLAMDQIRVQQEELRRRTDAVRWQRETIEHPAPRRARRWPFPRRGTLVLATTARPCVDC
jgi:hypothetical protein